ncbi:conserved hypothetical protein; putative signal peptide [Methylocella silvestris BL2]|uniref:Oxidoreductase molybdopterin-binding domain-containing protein n=1 Tax=Methylocella silvestris (strain DSM 15510 / CIP 108128 / LMG 27833 / NCIMB 13906 / BL2) TaxID=395965 RepID=B8ELD2_METSB|nr:molybdopterin-dependent oxidoreductase [Methylocella silvestris]ACK49521.1 conserved hypothetical protein; putative signal peptide [Methylocella silvestris BL2]
MKSIFAAFALVGALLVSPIAVWAQSAPPTASFIVSGEVTQRLVVNLAKLKTFPVASADVTYFAAGAVTTHSFTGVLLWDVLQKAGIVVDPTVKNDILRKTVTVYGSDGYVSVFSVGEIDPFFGGNQIILAYAQDGASLGNSGLAKLVAPGDKAGGRFVSNIARITVRDSGR